MCNYFSGIITKNGQVLWLKDAAHGDPMRHEAIKAANNLTNQDEGIEYVLFEITPNNLEQLLQCKTYDEILETDWNFKVDTMTVPKWFEDKAVTYIAQAFSAWNESKLLHLLPSNVTRHEIKNNDYIASCWGKIAHLCGNAQIKNVFGNAQIENVSGDAQIKNVSGNAQIKYVFGNAQIKNVSGDAQIENVCGNAQIKYVFGNAQIKYVFGNATVIKNNIIYVSKTAKIKRCPKKGIR